VACRVQDATLALMKHTTRRQLLGSLGALGAMVAVSPVALASGGLREGTSLPDLKVTGLDGVGVSVTEAIRGRVALLNFWATWCGPCMQELPALDSLHRKLQANPDVMVLAINVDQGLGLSFLAEFWRRYRLELPLLVDAAGRASSVYRLAVLPMTYIVDREGVVRHALAGARNWQSDQWVKGLEGLAGEKQTG
jgi:thiol-disulfide isomerase/thioredoxin